MAFLICAAVFCFALYAVGVIGDRIADKCDDYRNPTDEEIDSFWRNK